MSDDQIFRSITSPWGALSRGIGGLCQALTVILLLCTPAIVWAVYTWAF